MYWLSKDIEECVPKRPQDHTRAYMYTEWRTSSGVYALMILCNRLHCVNKQRLILSRPEEKMRSMICLSVLWRRLHHSYLRERTGGTWISYMTTSWITHVMCTTSWITHVMCMLPSRISSGLLEGHTEVSWFCDKKDTAVQTGDFTAWRIDCHCGLIHTNIYKHMSSPVCTSMNREAHNSSINAPEK